MGRCIKWDGKLAVFVLSVALTPFISPCLPQELGVNPGGAADVATVGMCVAFFFIDTALYLLIAW